MRGTNQTRETLQDRAVGWETHLEIEAPQCSLQQSPTSPAEAVWGSTATAVPSLYELRLSQEKCQTSALSMLPVTVQLCVPNKAIRQDEKANVREQRLLREEFCKLIIEVIISSKKKNGRQLRRGTWTYTSVAVNRGWGQRKRTLRWQLFKLETVKGEGREGGGQGKVWVNRRLGKSTWRKGWRQDRTGEVI